MPLEDPLNPTGTPCEKKRKLYTHTIGEVKEFCCRTLFTDADEYCEEAEQYLEQNNEDESELERRLEDLCERLESGCCHSGFNEAGDHAEAMRKCLESS